jgi:hypothetical protein
MCDLDKEFKMCTCKSVDPKLSHWKLIRFDQEPNKVMGIIGEIDEKRQNFAEMLKTELNSRNCFDFDYTPQNNDRLIFQIKSGKYGRTICFEYHESYGNSWWSQRFLYSNSHSYEIHSGEVILE